MELTELMALSPLDEVGVANFIEPLEEALESILGDGEGFKHFGIVYGGSGSMRIFLQEPYGGSISSPLTSPNEIAHELMRFAHSEARYPESPSPESNKGWRIRSVTIEGHPAAIAEAVWVD